MIQSLFRRKSLFTPSPVEMVFSYLALGIWAFVVLFPLYWLLVTSFKLPIDVDNGPFYVPFVDFKPSLHAWKYILVGDLKNDTFRELCKHAGHSTYQCCTSPSTGDRGSLWT